jgi:hypothetical protein
MYAALLKSELVPALQKTHLLAEDPYVGRSPSFQARIATPQRWIVSFVLLAVGKDIPTASPDLHEANSIPEALYRVSAKGKRCFDTSRTVSFYFTIL